jgi:hypothetical protein
MENLLVMPVRPPIVPFTAAVTVVAIWSYRETLD